MLISARNKYQIRLPYVSAVCSEKDLEDTVVDQSVNFLNRLESIITLQDSEVKGHLHSRLLIYTNRKNAVSSFFPVNAAQPIGFTAPRIIRPRKDSVQPKVMKNPSPPSDAGKDSSPSDDAGKGGEV